MQRPSNSFLKRGSGLRVGEYGFFPIHEQEGDAFR